MPTNDTHNKEPMFSSPITKPFILINISASSFSTKSSKISYCLKTQNSQQSSFNHFTLNPKHLAKSNIIIEVMAPNGIEHTHESSNMQTHHVTWIHACRSTSNKHVLYACQNANNHHSTEKKVKYR